MKKRRTCKLCGKPAKAHFLCSMHYERFRRNGDPTIIKVGNYPKECLVCGNTTYAKGLCSLHYSRYYRTGITQIISKKCIVEACNKKVDQERLCKTHYKMWSITYSRVMNYEEYVEVLNRSIRLKGRLSD